MQHGLPIFEAGPDKFEMRYGASGRNYSQAPLRNNSGALAAAAHRVPQPVHNGQSSIRRSLPSSGSFAYTSSSSNGLANDRENPVKRRKTVHTGNLGGDVKAVAREAFPAESNTSRRTATVVDLTITPAYEGGIVSIEAIGGYSDSCSLPSFQPRTAHQLAIPQEPDPEEDRQVPDPLVVFDNETDLLLLRKVLKMINSLLKPYEHLTTEERKIIIEKVRSQWNIITCRRMLTEFCTDCRALVRS